MLKGAANTVLPLTYYDHAVLRKQAKPVTRVTAAVRELAEQMMVAVRHHDGIGLAAPQVGQSVRLIVLALPRPDGTKAPMPVTPGELSLLPRMPMALLNPKLSEFSAQTSKRSEGCLSIPKVYAEVERPEFVQLQAETLAGETISFRCGGLLARCLQHEVDHLDGILFIDRLTPAALASIAEELELVRKQYRRARA